MHGVRDGTLIRSMTLSRTRLSNTALTARRPLPGTIHSMLVTSLLRITKQKERPTLSQVREHGAARCHRLSVERGSSGRSRRTVRSASSNRRYSAFFLSLRFMVFELEQLFPPGPLRVFAVPNLQPTGVSLQIRIRLPLGIALFRTASLVAVGLGPTSCSL